MNIALEKSRRPLKSLEDIFYETPQERAEREGTRGKRTPRAAKKLRNPGRAFAAH